MRSPKGVKSSSCTTSTTDRANAESDARGAKGRLTANTWFGQWANQVGIPTLTGLAERLLAAGHKAIVSSELSPSADVITDLVITFTQGNGPGKCTIEFRRGQDKSVAVFYAVNGTQGAGGRVEPPDPVTVDRFAQNYIIEALEGPRW